MWMKGFGILIICEKLIRLNFFSRMRLSCQFDGRDVGTCLFGDFWGEKCLGKREMHIERQNLRQTEGNRRPLHFS
jgi:hypothetical protein